MLADNDIVVTTFPVLASDYARAEAESESAAAIGVSGGDGAASAAKGKGAKAKAPKKEKAARKFKGLAKGEDTNPVARIHW